MALLSKDNKKERPLKLTYIKSFKKECLPLIHHLLFNYLCNNLCSLKQKSMYYVITDNNYKNSDTNKKGKKICLQK